MSTETTTENQPSSNPTTEGPSWSAEQISEMQRELADSRKQISSLSESAKTVDKLRQVFNPESAPQVDEDQAFLDHYLEQALNADKNGTPIPLTTNLAVKLFEERQRAKEMEKRLQSLDQKVQQISDPMVIADRQAFNSIDNLLENTLSGLYGSDGYAPQVFSAAANLIVEEIKKLQSSSPEVWDQIKKSGQMQKKMVSHFVNKVIPEKARTAMHREEMEHYELSPQELLNAFREANEIPDPKARVKIRAEIRQQLLSTMVQNKKSQSLSSKLSKMY
jgi:hypothetical protein